MASLNKASLLEGATTSLKRSIEQVSEKGALYLLTVLLLKEHIFFLHKTAFHDAMALRYGWGPVRFFTTLCLWNYSRFTVEYSFTCPKGGLSSICHNETCDLTASLLTEVCHEVDIEPL